MDDLKGTRVLLTGGSRGLGFSIAAALRNRGAEVAVVVRGPPAALDQIGATAFVGDATDRDFMLATVREVNPSVLILNAGATPTMGPLDQQSWESFTSVWDNDVKSGLFGIQAALAAPMAEGGRILIASSGAALIGAELSGSYAGAKRMLWFMTRDANRVAKAKGLDLRFQTLVPMQLIGDTNLGRTVGSAYAARQGITIEEHLARRYGDVRLTPDEYGAQVADLLADPGLVEGEAIGFRHGSTPAPLDS